MAARQGREAATNFAAQLGGFVAVIGVEKLAGGMAVRTAASARQGVESLFCVKTWFTPCIRTSFTLREGGQGGPARWSSLT